MRTHFRSGKSRLKCLSQRLINVTSLPVCGLIPSPLTISVDQRGVTINPYGEPRQVDTEIARNDEKKRSNLRGLQVDDGVGEGRAEMQQ